MKEKPYKMLIVDDSEMIREKISDLFGHICELHTASNEEEAIIMFRALLPDLVTMDMTMKGSSANEDTTGINCIKFMKQHYPKARIAVVSALKDRSTNLAAMQAGAIAFVNKPFTSEKLIDLVNVMLKDIKNG